MLPTDFACEATDSRAAASTLGGTSRRLEQSSDRVQRGGGGGEHGLALDERRDEPVLHHAQLEQLGRQPRRLEEGSEKARGRV